jgi:hypothetical protein
MAKKATPTRTLNPLPFTDLEPHRFEDLIRQLAYGWKPWSKIEATGRLGRDEGLDIRAEDPTDEVSTPNLWFIQCKREKTIAPKKMKAIVQDSLRSGSPFGFILAAACDFSLDTRNVFRSECVAKGLKEFHLWGKAEIEDRLFLPENDRLLFAYFGLSLQPRMRSQKAEILHRMAIKRKLLDSFGPFHQSYSFNYAVVHSITDEVYPHEEVEGVKGLWRCYRFLSHYPPDCVTFLVHQYFGYFDPETKEWDVDTTLDLDEGRRRRFADHLDEKMTKAEEFHQSLPIDKRAYINLVGKIHYDDIVVVDEIGDYWLNNENQQGFIHVFADYRGDVDPFSKILPFAVTDQNDVRVDSYESLEQLKRKSVFPNRGNIKVKL